MCRSPRLRLPALLFVLVLTGCRGALPAVEKSDTVEPGATKGYPGNPLARDQKIRVVVDANNPVRVGVMLTNDKRVMGTAGPDTSVKMEVTIPANTRYEVHVTGGAQGASFKLKIYVP